RARVRAGARADRAGGSGGRPGPRRATEGSLPGRRRAGLSCRTPRSLGTPARHRYLVRREPDASCLRLRTTIEGAPMKLVRVARNVILASLAWRYIARRRALARQRRRSRRLI